METINGGNGPAANELGALGNSGHCGHGNANPAGFPPRVDVPAKPTSASAASSILSSFLYLCILHMYEYVRRLFAWMELKFVSNGVDGNANEKSK